MHIAYLLVGGNLGDRLENLETARRKIRALGTILEESALYETAAWGKEDQPAFLNQALKISTTLSAQDLLTSLLEIEKELGRSRMEKYGPRLIDIDILFFDDAVINEAGLHVPHPQLQHRRFALVCLNEVAPTFVHPVLKKNVHSLLLDCADPLPVKKWK